MLTLQLYEIDNNFDELERRLIELQKAEASVGYYAEQGEHKPSKMPYTNLIGLMSTGYSPNNLPARPIFEKARFRYKPKKTGLKKDLVEYFSDIKTKKSKDKVDKVLMGWVEDFSKEVLDIFGQTPPLKKNADSTIAQKTYNKINSPLVDTGDLKDNLAYKINEDAYKTIKELG